MDALEHTGLPFAPIARPEDLIDDPHLNAGGLVEVTLADGRTAKLPAMPVAFGDQRLGLRLDLPTAQ
jgi:crotonobetainyl-CoA:carnitine CoA-transferase CaiB-like acyl-CoA transferase